MNNLEMIMNLEDRKIVSPTNGRKFVETNTKNDNELYLKFFNFTMGFLLFFLMLFYAK